MLPSRLGCPLSLKTPNMGNPGLTECYKGGPTGLGDPVLSQLVDLGLDRVEPLVKLLTEVVKAGSGPSEQLPTLIPASGRPPQRSQSLVHLLACSLRPLAESLREAPSLTTCLLRGRLAHVQLAGHHVGGRQHGQTATLSDPSPPVQTQNAQTLQPYTPKGGGCGLGAGAPVHTPKKKNLPAPHRGSPGAPCMAISRREADAALQTHLLLDRPAIDWPCRT